MDQDEVHLLAIHVRHITNRARSSRERAGLSVIGILHGIITQSESSGSGTTGKATRVKLISPSMRGRVPRRSSALGLRDEMPREVAVICTIKSSRFSSELRLKMFLADIQRARASFFFFFLFTAAEQLLDDTLLHSATRVINVTSLAPSAAASDCLLP